MAAATSAREYDPRRGSLWGWLWGIARRQVALHYRKRARAERFTKARHWWSSLDGNKTKWLTSGLDTPSEILASRELAELVRAALAELPSAYQVLLIGRYLDGVSAPQLAADANSTASAVRSKLVRARRAFRRARRMATLERSTPATSQPCRASQMALVPVPQPRSSARPGVKFPRLTSSTTSGGVTPVSQGGRPSK